LKPLEPLPHSHLQLFKKVFLLCLTSAKEGCSIRITRGKRKTATGALTTRREREPQAEQKQK
jgi:hypothetical protein